jgi:hypothetical protein
MYQYLTLLMKAQPSRIAGCVKGPAELSDARRSDRPTAAVALALHQRAGELLRNHRQITTTQLENELLGYKGSVKNIVDS